MSATNIQGELHLNDYDGVDKMLIEHTTPAPMQSLGAHELHPCNEVLELFRRLNTTERAIYGLLITSLADKDTPNVKQALDLLCSHYGKTPELLEAYHVFGVVPFVQNNLEKGALDD